ncbi:MAG TPA: mercury(II) reductase [Nitrososphaeraceae archaeon]|nr:mercury(II) reductase [Nitrososphaeraceae archaeon]
MSYSERKFDLVIIGGGAAAFSAAIKAESHGVKTAMIERHVLGGTCVNLGCIPSKNLLGAGELLHSSRHPSYSAISACSTDLDFTQVIQDKDNLVRILRSNKYEHILSTFENVQFIEGEATFVSNKVVKVNGRRIESDKFIIATGSSPIIPAINGIDTVDYLTNVQALSLKQKPSSMVVIGGRALGLEFAQMYSRFGTKVTLLQRSGRIIPTHEPEISEKLKHYLRDEGIEIFTCVDITDVNQENGTKFVKSTSSKNGEERIHKGEQLLIATGRRPNTADLHLENAGVKLRENNDAILVNSEMHTSMENIWAAGDVVGEPMLESVAAKEGSIAADNSLTDNRKSIDFLSVPSAIFTSPQVASVGLTEIQMIEEFGFCSCKTLEMNQVPKALTVNQTKGLIKMVVNPEQNNTIVGVHILADLAADIIHEAVLAVKHRFTIDDIIDTVHVFPTMTEAIKLVATSFKQDLKKLTCCAE